MYEKLTKLFLLILLFLLQSCSGGKIGNFLESSFKNTDLNDSVQKENNILKMNNNISNKKPLTNELTIEKNQKSKILNKNQSKVEKIKNNEKLLVKKNKELDNIEFKTEPKSKTDLINKRKNFKPQSYRITVILKEVDPSSPLENFSNVLKDSNLNFEIENIQRYPTNKNTNNKRE